jgi:hypothetical protein
VSFDLALAEQGLPIFQYDPTIDGPPINHPRFNFRKLAWSKNDSELGRSLRTIVAQTWLRQPRRQLSSSARRQIRCDQEDMRIVRDSARMVDNSTAVLVANKKYVSWRFPEGPVT